MHGAVVTGLEGGLEVDADGKMQCFAWMVLLSGGDGAEKVGAARTATFEIPEKVRDKRACLPMSCLAADSGL